jgi:hypothetical protein
MLSINLLLFVCLGYVALLFALAFYVDRRARQGRLNWLRSPVVYTLSISVYCTSWTFYGAVGSAARNGLEFITIYLGPTLVFVGWWWLLRKLVRIGRTHRITSIADLISSRYGKSSSLAVLVTVIAVIATTPYIALQLQAVTRSFQVIAGEADGATTAFWVAAGMALFTILFGTRNLDANERHHGVVAAIAFEAIVKLVALIAVGIFVVYGVAGGLGDIFADVPSDVIYGGGDIFGPRWVALTFLSATAIICLPRQFQMTVVENVDERHLATASWLFPLYLFGMALVPPTQRTGAAGLPRRLLLGHLDGDHHRHRRLDHGLEPHRDADRPVFPIRRASGQRRCAQPAADHTPDQHRGDPGARLSLFPPQRRLGRAGGDRADRLCRRCPIHAQPDRRHLLARRHPCRGAVWADGGVCPVGLYPVPAQLRRPFPVERGSAE